MGQGEPPYLRQMNQVSPTHRGSTTLGQPEGRKARGWSSFSICLPRSGQKEGASIHAKPRKARAWHTVGMGKSKAVTLDEM